MMRDHWLRVVRDNDARIDRFPRMVDGDPRVLDAVEIGLAYAARMLNDGGTFDFTPFDRRLVFRRAPWGER